jgi:cytochrome o ubiquinol oxidase subunit 2
VMNSFFVPQLGSQVYTMAGMISQLSLEADKPGRYGGLSAQFSGRGFAGMHFTVNAIPAAAYAQWVSDRQAAGPALDKTTYILLEKPSENVEPISYKFVDPTLFDAIVAEPASAIAGSLKKKRP